MIIPITPGGFSLVRKFVVLGVIQLCVLNGVEASTDGSANSLSIKETTGSLADSVKCGISDGDIAVGVQVITDLSCVDGGLGCYNDHCRYCQYFNTYLSAHLQTCSSFGIDFPTPSPSVAIPATCDISAGDWAAGIRSVNDLSCMYGGLGCYNEYCRYCKVEATDKSGHLLPCFLFDQLDSNSSDVTPTVDGTTPWSDTGDTTSLPADTTPTLSPTPEDETPIPVDIVNPSPPTPLSEAPMTPFAYDSSSSTSVLPIVEPSPSTGETYAPSTDSPDFTSLEDPIYEPAQVDTTSEAPVSPLPDTSVCPFVVSDDDAAVGMAVITDTTCVDGGSGCFEGICRFCKRWATPQSIHLLDCPTAADSVNNTATEIPVTTNPDDLTPEIIDDYGSFIDDTTNNGYGSGLTDSLAPVSTGTIASSRDDVLDYPTTTMEPSLTSVHEPQSSGNSATDSLSSYGAESNEPTEIPNYGTNVGTGSSVDFVSPPPVYSVGSSSYPSDSGTSEPLPWIDDTTTSPTPLISGSSESSNSGSSGSTVIVIIDPFDKTPPCASSGSAAGVGTVEPSGSSPTEPSEVPSGTIWTVSPTPSPVCSDMTSNGDLAMGIILVTDSTCIHGGLGCTTSACRFCKFAETSQSQHLLNCTELGYPIITPTPVTDQCTATISEGDEASGIDVITDPNCVYGGLGCFNDVCRFCKRTETTLSAYLLDCPSEFTTAPPSSSGSSSLNQETPFNPSEVGGTDCTSTASEGDVAVGIQLVTDPTCAFGGVGCTNSVCRFCKFMETSQSTQFVTCSSLGYTFVSPTPTPTSTPKCSLTVSGGDAAVGINITTDTTCASGGIGCINNLCRFCKMWDTVQSSSFLSCSSIDPNATPAPTTSAPVSTTVNPSIETAAAPGPAVLFMCSKTVTSGDAAVGINITADPSCADGGIGCIDLICRYCKTRETTQSSSLLSCASLANIDFGLDITFIPIPSLTTTATPTPTTTTTPSITTPSPTIDPCNALVSSGDQSVGISGETYPSCANGGLGCFSTTCRYCRSQDTASSMHLAPCGSSTTTLRVEAAVMSRNEAMASGQLSDDSKTAKWMIGVAACIGIAAVVGMMAVLTKRLKHDQIEQQSMKVMTTDQVMQVEADSENDQRDDEDAEDDGVKDAVEVGSAVDVSATS